MIKLKGSNKELTIPHENINLDCLSKLFKLERESIFLTTDKMAFFPKDDGSFGIGGGIKEVFVNGDNISVPTTSGLFQPNTIKTSFNPLIQTKTNTVAKTLKEKPFTKNIIRVDDAYNILNQVKIK
jgi:hypothetical protein